MSSLTSQITKFVQDIVSAMDVTLTANVEETPDGARINLEGEDGGVLVRRGGEGLQHVGPHQVGAEERARCHQQRHGGAHRGGDDPDPHHDPLHVDALQGGDLRAQGDGAHREMGHGAGPCMLHNPSYDFNDALIPLGAAYWVRLAEAWLADASLAAR